MVSTNEKVDEIEFRVFDYGYKYALDNRRNPDHLIFPTPRILQLYAHKGLPNSKSITLDFGFMYAIPDCGLFSISWL